MRIGASLRAAPNRPAYRPAARGRLHTLQPVVEWLTQFGRTDHWVVSCYLKLEPRDRARAKYLIKLKNRIRTRLAWLQELGVPRRERDAVERDLRRVREYLADPGSLHVGRGIAVFACEPLQLFETVPLPKVFRSRLAIDHSPLVRELAAVEDEFGLIVCAVCDRTSARLFEVTAFGVVELPSLAAPEATRGRFRGTGALASPGPSPAAPGEHNYHQRIRAEKGRHFAQIAQRLFALVREEPVRGIVLAGPGTEAGAVASHLHSYVAKLVLGTAKLSPKGVTPGEVLEAVLKVRRASERAWERDHLRVLGEALGNRWAVAGVEAALQPLARGQVRTLLVDPDVERPGFRCRQSGRLTTRAGGCDAEGGTDPVPDVIDEAVEEALRQGGEVDVIEHADAAAQFDGLAALLRFPLR